MSTTESRPRIAPLQPPCAPDIAAQLSKWMPPETAIEPLALFRTLAVHDELFGRMINAAQVPHESWARRFPN